MQVVSLRESAKLQLCAVTEDIAIGEAKRF